MEFFTPVEDGYALIMKNGSYTILPLFVRQGLIYVKRGSSFLKLGPNNDVSDNSSWIQIDPGQGQYKKDGCYLRWVSPIAMAAE